MNKTHLYDTIISPVLTEKSTNLSEQNKIVFKVPYKANKKNLKKNIEKIFKVNVTKINIINKKTREKSTRGKKVKVPGSLYGDHCDDFVRFSLSQPEEKISKSIQNIPNVKTTDINHFSAFDIVKYKKLVFTESSIKELEKRYS